MKHLAKPRRQFLSDLGTGFASLALGIDIDASDRVAISARARSDFGRDTDEDTALSLAINWRF